MIKKGTKIQCLKCLEYSRLSSDVESMSVLECQNCGAHQLLGERAIPKVPPNVPCDTEWKVEQAAEEPGNEEPKATASFKERADEISACMLQAYTLVDSLKKDMEKFSEAIAKEFEKEWCIADSLQKSWDPRLMLDFVQNPFSFVPTGALDEVANSYSRWMICPKFYTGTHGIPVGTNCGFRRYLISPYSMIVFPLESWLCEAAGLEPLELEVKGTKITGNSLYLTWREIPGIVEDDDHTDDVPSIRIRNGFEARTWLATHGVRAWSGSPLNSEKFIPAITSVIESKPGYSQAWRKFRDKGRLGIFWPQVNSMREFAYLAAAQVPGIKVIICDSESSIKEWKKSVGGTGMASKEIRYICWDEVSTGKYLEQAEVIVAEFFSNTEDLAVRLLYDYTGPLLTISNDPVLDTLEDNYYAPMLYGLICDGSIKVPADWQTGWQKKSDSDLGYALKQLRGS